MAVCLVLSPLLWVGSLAPKVPGVAGVLLWPLLTLLEFLGVLSKCFALMVRLFANMTAGHMLLAVLMMFVLQSLHGPLQALLGVGVVCILASAVMSLLDVLVAVGQAYILTFLVAIFLSLYTTESAHGH